jgi:phosphoglycerate dehydrogenase-like enzyme
MVVAGKKTVVITMERSALFEDIFQPDIMADLERYANVITNDTGRRLTTEELIERSANADALITAWGTPFVDARIVDAAPKLRIISHAAGSVKNLIDHAIWDKGIMVTNAAGAIAKYVGEFCLTATLALLRSLPAYAHGAPTEEWEASDCYGNETLFHKRVGLIGLGHTARSFLRVLSPFECEVVAYDPYISPERTRELGARLVSLEELLSTSKVISLHAPITEETKGLLNAENLRLIQHGAAFVNTARGVLVDHDALYRELKTGRFKAALDVTFPEPLPVDHPLRSLPNCLITPHIAGPTKDGRRDLFRTVVDDLILFWTGQTPRNVVTKQMLATMA